MDAIQEYQGAVDSMKAAIAAAERISRTVAAGAAALRDWKRAVVANVGVGLPAEVTLAARGASLDGADWPTGVQIAETLGRYHEAKQALENAYRRIPDGQRAVVQPPATFF